MSFITRLFQYTPLEQELLSKKNEFPGEKVQIDTHNVFVVDFPPKNKTTADPITYVLIHGLGGCCIAFKYLVEQFNKNARVLTVDLPGHGNSDYPADTSFFNPETTAQFVVELIKTKTKGKFIILGHSYGTSHSLRVANALKERCLGVICIAPPYQMHVPQIALFGAGVVPPVLFRSVMRLTDGNGGLYSASMKRFFYEDANEQVRRDQLQINLQSNTETVLQSISKMRFYELSDGVPQCPILVIGATYDQICKVDQARKLAKDLKERNADTTYVEIDKAGHGVMFEKPAEVLSAIDEFLAKHGLQNV